MCIWILGNKDERQTQDYVHVCQLLKILKYSFFCFQNFCVCSAALAYLHFFILIHFLLILKMLRKEAHKSKNHLSVKLEKIRKGIVCNAFYLVKRNAFLVLSFLTCIQNFKMVAIIVHIGEHTAHWVQLLV